MLKKILLISLCCVLSACTTPTGLKHQNLAAAHINATLALAYLEQNNTLRGKIKLLLAQKQAPDDPVVWYVSGYFLESTSHTKDAEYAYLYAIKLAPKLGSAQNNYGAFLCRQGKYSLAIHYFLAAIADPEYLAVAAAYKNAAYCALKIPNKSLADYYFHLAAAYTGAYK